jgi:uncharacterized protein
VIRVSALTIFPVKACGGIDVSRARVVERGLELDRRYMIVDEAGEFVTQRDRRELSLVRATFADGGFELSAPGQLPLFLPRAHQAGPRVRAKVWDHDGLGVPHDEGSAWFAAYLKGAYRLVYMPDDHERPVNPERARLGDMVSFADGYPLLVISEASLAELNRRLAAPITMRRFRPNIVLSGCQPFAEDSFARVRIGSLWFRGPKRCDRCVVTTIDPETGEAGQEPLRALATFRKEHGKVWFGMNLIHDDQGELAVGDEVAVG